MRILIEGYPYRYDDVKDLVPLDNVWGDVEKSVYMPYVGYYYNYWCPIKIRYFRKK